MMDWERLLLPERIRRSSTGNPVDRSEFERDYDRIIFSKPFRRLQKKTQVFPLPENDYIHTRLTHSLETSCVGRSLGMAAGKDIIDKYQDLQGKSINVHNFAAVVAAAALAHDIGNPPFGHSGENAISDFFKSIDGTAFLKDLSEPQQLDFQNFEGNAMGFRLMIHTLPGVSSIPGGLNLTYATIGAFTKYPREIASKKLPGASGKKHGFFQTQKELFKQIADKLGMLPKENSSGIVAYHRHPLAFLVEAADDISYLIMDLEDGYSLKLVEKKEVEDTLQSLLLKEVPATILDKIHDNRERISYLRAIAISSLVNQTSEVFKENLPEIMEGKFDTPLADEIKTAKQLKELKTLCKEKVYSYRKVLEIESAGFEVIGGLLFEFLSALKNDTEKAKKIRSLLPKHYIIEHFDTPDQWYEAIMHVVQFVAGMTDTFAIDTYRSIKGIRLPNY